MVYVQHQFSSWSCFCWPVTDYVTVDVVSDSDDIGPLLGARSLHTTDIGTTKESEMKRSALSKIGRAHV